MNTRDKRAPSFNRAPVDRSREVLVVDDEADVRELLVEFLRGMSLKVASAKDGRAAITALERDPDRYWLVVTDIIPEYAEALKSLGAETTRYYPNQAFIVRIARDRIDAVGDDLFDRGREHFLAERFALLVPGARHAGCVRSVVVVDQSKGCLDPLA